MDSKKLEDFIRDFNEFKRQWGDIYRELSQLRRNFDDLRRELGVQEGQLLKDQVERIEESSRKNEQRLSEVLVSVENTRKLVEYGDKSMKEIMKALALIYRNTDELEGGLLDNRETS